MRSGKNWRELLRFGVVGASGVIVNMATVVVLTAIGPGAEDAVVRTPASDFHVRWYHVFSFTAFLIANLWNFHWNRMWTFRSRGHWGQQYGTFLTVGVIIQVVGLAVLTLLMHHASPVSLSPKFFDDSTFLLTRVYWAQLATIAIVTPASFLLNKLWTFGRGMGPIAESA